MLCSLSGELWGARLWCVPSVSKFGHSQRPGHRAAAYGLGSWCLGFQAGVGGPFGLPCEPQDPGVSWELSGDDGRFWAF